MTSQHDKPKRWTQTSIRGLFMCVTVVAICAGWYVDRERLALRLTEAERELEAKQLELGNRLFMENIRMGVRPGFDGRMMTEREMAEELARTQLQLRESHQRIKQLERQ